MPLSLFDCLIAVQGLDRNAPLSARLPRLVLTVWLAILWMVWLRGAGQGVPALAAVAGTLGIALALKYALALPLWVLARWYPERLREVFLESGLEWPRRAAGRK